MADFKKLNGYFVKDQVARNKSNLNEAQIATLQNGLNTANGNITNLQSTKTNINNSLTKYPYGDRTYDIELRTSGSSGSENVSFVAHTPDGNRYDNIYNEKGEKQYFLKNEIGCLDLSSVLFIGDSFTQGYNPDGNIPESERWYKRVVDYFNIKKWQAFGGGGCGFAHVSGSIHKNLEQYYDSISSQLNDDITTVFIMCGVNDKDQEFAPITNAITSFMNKIRKKYPSSNCKYVYLINPCMSGIRRSTLEACYNTMRLNKVICLSSWWWCLLETGWYASDYLHPNSNGQQRIGDYVVQAMIGEVEHKRLLTLATGVNLIANNRNIDIYVSQTKSSSADRVLQVASLPAWYNTNLNKSGTGPTSTYVVPATFRNVSGDNECVVTVGNNSASIFIESGLSVLDNTKFTTGSCRAYATFDAFYFMCD